MHIAILTEKKTGLSGWPKLGSKEDVLAYARRNSDGHLAEVRPATDDEIEAERARLRSAISSARFELSNAPWAMGPTYRHQISKLESQLRELSVVEAAQ